jgi:arsenate reductase
MPTLYGIKNCDTVKKARAWLDAHGFEHVFHDYRAAGVDADRLGHWCDTLGWHTILNRAGTTFRKLSAADQTDLERAKALRLMIAHPTLIKRPVLECGDQVIVGFKPELYQRCLEIARA